MNQDTYSYKPLDSSRSILCVLGAKDLPRDKHGEGVCMLDNSQDMPGSRVLVGARPYAVLKLNEQTRLDSSSGPTQSMGSDSARSLL